MLNVFLNNPAVYQSSYILLEPSSGPIFQKHLVWPLCTMLDILIIMQFVVFLGCRSEFLGCRSEYILSLSFLCGLL